MSRLTYKNVFSRYEASFSHKLSQKAFSTYKSARLFFAKRHPLKEHERFLHDNFYSPNDKKTSAMPKGYDYLTQQEVDGKLELKYIDFFDYLPKEDTGSFKKKLRKFARSNKVPPFSSYRTTQDDDRLDNMERYSDGFAFINLREIAFPHNDYLKKYASQINISVHNLSASFLVVKYKVYISGAFNDELQEIYKGTFEPFSDVMRRFGTPWYKPWKFGRSIYQSDDARYQVIYTKLSELKWEIYKELKNSFKIYFSDDGMFLPVFATYHTNIRPSSDREKLKFWHSVGLSSNSDYSQPYNLCVGWDDKISKREGLHLSAFCGGDYENRTYLPEIAEFDCADFYCVYLVANTIRRIAERDIAIYNKKISKAIRKSGSAKLLRVRAKVEKKLYYSYRFMSEFSGISINLEEISSFYNPRLKDESLTKLRLGGIAKYIVETKKQIDSILYLLDDAAEYRTAKSNMVLQWVMMAVTVLSLVVAIIALTDVHFSAADIWTKLIELVKNHFNM